MKNDDKASNTDVHPSTVEPSFQIKKVSSHPPIPIALDVGHNVRHACLEEIRHTHETLLRPYIPSGSRLLLVDPAYHSNVGDHMITVAEQQFLHRPPECGYGQSNGYAVPCGTEIPRRRAAHNIALWHGGGNWGDLWRGAQEPRIRSLELLLRSNYERIVTLPNSWYYRDAALQQSDVGRIQKIVGSQNMDRLVFCWREQSSYEMSQLNFPGATHLLVPDMAFQLGPYAPLLATPQQQQPRSDLLVLLRDDHESLYQRYRDRLAFRELLQSVPGASDLSYSIVDWKDRLTRFDNPDIFFTDTSIQLLSSGRVVICDRLHAAILAYLSELPFVYLDQISGKIHKTLSVAMRTPKCQQPANFARGHNLTHAIELAVTMLQTTPRTRIQESDN